MQAAQQGCARPFATWSRPGAGNQSLGSPASSGSSSGLECGSQREPTEEPRQNPRHSHKDTCQQEEEDYLEVNEPPASGSWCRLYSSGMSEFSAATLQRSSRIKKFGRQDVESGRPEAGRVWPRRADCLECRLLEATCCAYQWAPAAVRQPARQGRQVVGDRRDTRPRSVGGGGTGRLVARWAAGGRSRSLVRRSLPIPPPVVPLWKELELLGPRGRPEESGQLRVDLWRPTNMEEPPRSIHLAAEASSAFGSRRGAKVLEEAGQISQLAAQASFGRHQGSRAPIYDTPERDARAAADCGAGRRLASARRPNEPPPPPPPPHKPAEEAAAAAERVGSGGDGCARKLASGPQNARRRDSVEGQPRGRAGAPESSEPPERQRRRRRSASQQQASSQEPNSSHHQTPPGIIAQPEVRSTPARRARPQVQGFKAPTASSPVAWKSGAAAAAASMGAHQSAPDQSRGPEPDSQPGPVKLLKAACKTGWHSAAKQVVPANGASDSAGGEHLSKLAVLETEEQFNIRRKSLQDGDVFIYPAHYKDSNVCSVCGRDFRVCSCNQSPPASAPNGFGRHEEALARQDETLHLKQQQQQQQLEAADQTTKTYKISIATASIDQMRNQLRVSSPKIIVASSRGSPQPMGSPVGSQMSAGATNGAELVAALSSPLTAFSMSEPSHAGSSIDRHGSEPEVRSAQLGKLTSISIGQSSEHLDALDVKHFLSAAQLAAESGPSLDCNNNNHGQPAAASIGQCKQAEDVGGDERLAADIEKGDRYYENRLTCNLEVGDSIKITSTSMLINAGEHKQLLASHSSESAKTPGPAAAAAAANTTTTNANEDYTSIIPVTSLSARRRHVSIKLTRRPTIEPSSTDSADDGSPLEPIKGAPGNLGPLEGRGALCGAYLAQVSPGSLDNSSSDVLEYSPILTSARDYINNVNTNELQVQSSVVVEPAAGGASGAVPADGSNECASPELARADPLQLVSARVAIDASSAPLGPINQGGGEQGGSANALVALAGGAESPKKSIFEGASKAEILEYLEDARERVPEILMAADEVMVINDNELIVVNQLEPGAPATPISIVDAVGGGSGSGSSQAVGAELNLSYLKEPIIDELTPSQVQAQLDDYTNTDMSASDISLILRAAAADKDSSSRLAEVQTVNQVAETRADQWRLEALFGGPPQHQQLTASSSHGPPEAEERRQASRLRRASGHSSSFMRVLARSGQNRSELGELARLRQNSTSSDGSAVHMSSLQLKRLKQLYSNRNSLSSASSSPPSSASPGSLTSSNRTSGNCSAASNFYASSSLSCSSPLLALNGGATSPGLSRPPSAAAFSPRLLPGGDTNGAPQKAPADPPATPNLNPLTLSLRDASAGSDPLALLSPHIDKHLDELKSIISCDSAAAAATLLQNIATECHEFKAADTTCLLDGEEPPEVLASTSVKLESIVADSTKLSVIDESKPLIDGPLGRPEVKQVKKRPPSRSNAFNSPADLVSRALHGHYATMNRLNNYLRNRSANSSSPEALIEFQCLDCDQFIDVDQATMTNKSNELRFLSRYEQLQQPDAVSPNSSMGAPNGIIKEQEAAHKEKPLKAEQLDRAYIAAMNGLPLCKSCDKKRIERKEIISEFVDTELKYGCDLKIIYDEFYRPMQVAGLLSRDQINGIFLNLEELMISNRRFAERLQVAISEALSMGDTYFNILNIGRLFIESAEMLSTYESYCIRQGSAACLLARLAKEKELLRIFLRVSQMENTVLRRMNLAAFLMVPVQRVTRYPLLLNRLYKVTAYHHKDRELLRDAQLKVELHLEHINQQTKGIGATNKIWRRISNLSAPNRRCLINAEDIGYMKLRKTALDLLKWDREETQFIHSGKLHLAPLYEFLTKQKAKPLRYMPTHALLIALGKPNWAYRPDLVKANFDHKLITPTPGGTGIREVALLLFREKNGRYTPCREPLYLSNCVLSADCSQFNNECVSSPPKATTGASTNSGCPSSAVTGRKSIESKSLTDAASCRSRSAGDKPKPTATVKPHGPKMSQLGECNSNSSAGDSVSMVSTKSLPEDNNRSCSSHSSRSNSLASALTKQQEHQAMHHASSSGQTANKVSSSTIINQFMTKVNSYHIKPMMNGSNKASQVAQQQSKKLPTAGNSASLTPDDATGEPTAHQMGAIKLSSSSVPNETTTAHNYNHLYFHNHLQTYGVYEESFEIHERLTKESLLLRADTPLKTRYWLQMLRYHAKDLGAWRMRRNALPNIMMMRHE